MQLPRKSGGVVPYNTQAPGGVEGVLSDSAGRSKRDEVHIHGMVSLSKGCRQLLMLLGFCHVY
jgi:hypothetical protein